MNWSEFIQGRFETLFGRTSASRSARSQASQLVLEQLESRRLLSVSSVRLSSVAPNLVIEGSELADSVTVSEQLPNVISVFYECDGQSFREDFDKSLVEKIVFHGLGGDDTFINQTDINSSAFGGDGNDTLRGGSGNDLLLGGAGNDTIKGGEGDDNLKGEDGADTLFGQAGDDLLVGGSNDDLLYGGTENDVLHGSEGNDFLRGESGNDSLSGDAGDDIIQGDEGDDIAQGDAGNDTIRGGDGADQLWGNEGADTIFGNAGNDSLFGGPDDDQLFGGAENDTLLGGDGNDQVRGEAGDDDLRGDEGNDTLRGNEGNDSIQGGNGADELHGDDGDDVLRGNAGADRLEGKAGNDTLVGGTGDDILFGGDDADDLYGSEGNDILSGNQGDDFLRGNEGIDQLDGGSGNDRLWGGDGNDSLAGSDGDDTLLGEAGTDLLDGGFGNDTLNGGLGDDSLWGGVGDDGLYGEEGDDTLSGNSGMDALFGGDGNDLVIGGDGDDVLYGEAGNDKLEGRDGLDRLWGGEGDDILNGGTEDDVLSGQGGADLIVGSSGDDTLIGGPGNDRLLGNAGNDKLRGEDGDDRLEGDQGDDELSGANGKDTLLGGPGNDNISGGEQDDRLYGGSGNDVLSGEAGHDRILGESGADTINGGTGNDTILGDSGDDTINGGDGNDFLSGKEGNDTIHGGEGIDAIFGGEGDDIANGNEGSDSIQGGLGNDVLNGLSGDDILSGGTGTDVLIGGEGNDILIGSSGNDTLDGRDGDDELFGGDGDDLLQGGKDKDRLSGGLGNDELNGGSDEDELRGNAGDDTLNGGSGNDSIYGNEGVDLLQGLDGDDYLHGGSENDTLEGGTGNDQLFGGDGEDLLDGGRDNDLLSGDQGDDSLDGSTGQDVLIGGQGIDSLDGASGEDLLIGGIVTHSENVLGTLLATWASSLSYEARVEAIEAHNFAAYLKSHDTVMDDYVPDSVMGRSELDWFFLPGVLGIHDVAETGGGHHGGSHESPHGTGGHHHGAPVILPHAPLVEGFALIDSLDHLDNTTGEAIHTLIPHGDDPVKQKEHLALFELVRYDQVTHAAHSSGNWSDPATWQDGIVPSDGSRVLIPVGIEVTVDGIVAQEPFSIRVDGTLSFASSVDTHLSADTIIGSAGSSLVMGTSSNPIAANATARLTFTDNGPIDRVYDPFGISRGLITHGSVEVHGVAKTPFLKASGNVVAGQTVLHLEQVPSNWQIGDTIMIAGTSSDQNEDETRTILAIAGNQVGIAPLNFDHLTPDPSLNIHVANLTRNVVFDSETTDIARRGHTMFMHNRDVHVAYASFLGLGRTDKSVPVNDSVVDANWQLTPGTGTNQRARYPVHFHRNGTLIDGSPSTFQGSVVDDSPGWGFVNHSSYVDFTDNVSANVNGAGFATEVGDETGSFQGNIALSTTGTDEKENERKDIQDFGHTGAGFWFQGAGVTVVDNVSVGSQRHGFIYYTRGLIEGADGLSAHYLTANLADPSIAAGADSILVDNVPVQEFQRNESYGSKFGLTVRYHLRTAAHDVSSTFRNSTFWNNETGVQLPYTKQTVLSDLRILRDFSKSLSFLGVSSNAVTANIVYDNLDISGYYFGIVVPRAGSAIINGGSFLTRSAIIVRQAVEAGRSLRVQGSINMVKFSPEVLQTAQFDLEMRFYSVPYQDGTDHLYVPQSIVLNYGPHTERSIYFNEQAADAIPFPVASDGVPPNYIGLTSQQLYDVYGIIPGGEFAPEGVVTDPAFIGLLDP